MKLAAFYTLLSIVCVVTFWIGWKLGGRKRQPMNQIPTNPLLIFVNLDSVEIICPCGQSVEGEGEAIVNFRKIHDAHANGEVATITADGQRALMNIQP